MRDAEDKRAEQAAAAANEEIPLFVHDPAPNVIKALLENRRLTEEDVLIIANRKNLPCDVLELIAKDKRWADSYPVRLALAKNPKTPLFSALGIARYLRLFDVAELARSHFLPLVYRHKLEAIIIEKMPAMALGIKKTLAKMASGGVLLKLIREGYPEVVNLCLNNPYLAEASLYKVINQKTTPPGAIKTIAEHPNWPTRSMIKFSLIRNEHTPLSKSLVFLTDMKVLDLRELYRDPSLPVGVKPLVYRELRERGVDVDKLHIDEETVYEIEEEEMEELEDEVKRFEEGGKEEEK